MSIQNATLLVCKLISHFTLTVIIISHYCTYCHCTCLYDLFNLLLVSQLYYFPSY